MTQTNNHNILVTKRDGTIENFMVEKVKKCIAWACTGLDVNPLALEAKFDEFLSEEVSSSSIQENLIMSARMLANKAEPDWTFVAGRLWTMQIWKETGAYKKPFGEYIQSQLDKGEYYGRLVDNILDVYSKDDIEYFESLIVQSKDLNHSFGSVLTASEKYLTKGECIQLMHMVNAMIVAIPEEHENRRRIVSEVYDVLSNRQLSKASPWLGNLRQGGNISSCFIIQPEDNIDSIFDNVKNSALISKNGGGLGVSLSRIRAEGGTVKGRENASKGVFGWARIFNDTALFVDQGGRRAGAFTVQVPIWHKDIEGFLEIQSETGDVRTKAYDIFPQVTVNDYFMELDANGGHEKTWHTFCPHEVKEVLGVELYNVFGKEFTREYKKCVKAYEQGKLKVVGEHNVRNLFKHVMKTHFDSGLPYTVFIDTVNADNPNNHEGSIPSANLCVAPETLILTDVGYKTIATLDDQEVTVWNGFEWSDVKIVKTGENQRLVSVKTSDGKVVDVTEHHKWYVPIDYKGNVVEKRTHELKTGDKLIKFDLPVIEGEKVLQDAYANGMFCGDGSQSGTYKRIYLYHEKRKLLKYIHGYTGCHHDENSNRTVIAKHDLKDKFFVPDTTYDVSSRLEWLAGLVDADGTAVNNGTNQSIQIGSVEFEFLNEISLMLQTLGVTSKVTKSRDDGKYELPLNDGSGENGLFNCRTVYRLIISSSGLFKLLQLGFQTHRVKLNKRLPQRNAEKFVSIVDVIDNGRTDDTYCANEPKRHLLVFNGIITGNCTESFSIVEPDKYAHSCNLASVVVGRCKDLDEIERVARIATRVLDNGILLTQNPVEIAKNHNERYRTIGVGIQGLHDWFAKEGKSYKDYKEAAHVAEAIQYGCVAESIQLAKERGQYPAFPGSKWDTGEQMNKYKRNKNAVRDWEFLEGELVKYGIRNSQLTSPAPNTSTSVFQDAGAGVMPVYMDFYQKDNGNGTFPFASMHLKTAPLSYAKNAGKWEHEHLVKTVAEIQKFTCAGISSEFFLDHNKEDFSAKELYDLIHMAWRNKLKALYYIRHIKKGKTYTDEIGVSEASCDGCAD